MLNKKNRQIVLDKRDLFSFLPCLIDLKSIKQIYTTQNEKAEFNTDGNSKDF